jgi:hypothetical protein
VPKTSDALESNKTELNDEQDAGMDTTLISATAALGGATIGGAMSFLGSWIVQQRQVRAQWVVQDRLRRQDLYKEFIQIASKCFADALQHDTPDIASIVVLYEKISRMRILSSPEVLTAAEQVFGKIIDTLSEPVKAVTNVELRAMFKTGKGDILRSFSDSCRAEFEALRAEQF